MDTFQELNTVFNKIFDEQEINISPEMTADNVDGWDSFSHTLLVVAIEKHFGIKFKTSEILPDVLGSDHCPILLEIK